MWRFMKDQNDVMKRGGYEIHGNKRISGERGSKRDRKRTEKDQQGAEKGRRKAKEAGLKGYSTLKKAELIELLKK